METEPKIIEDLDLASEQRKAVGFLAEFTKRMVLFAFPGNKTPESASNLIQEVYRITDEILIGCLKTGTKLACKKGCFWCCSMRVKVTPLEVLSIVDYLRSHLEPGDGSALRERLAAMDEITRGMDGYQRVCEKMVCPLLAEGLCTVYPVRPIACRVYHALKVSDCEIPLEITGRCLTIRHDIFGLSMGIIAGLTEGLRTVGLRSRQLELVAGLRVAMDEERSRLVLRWLSGEPVFVEAEIPETKKIESQYWALLEELEKPHQNSEF